MLKVIRNTIIGFDKIYELNKCSQSELKYLWEKLPNLRSKYLIQYEAKKPKTRKSKQIQPKGV